MGWSSTAPMAPAMAMPMPISWVTYRAGNYSPAGSTSIYDAAKLDREVAAMGNFACRATGRLPKDRQEAMSMQKVPC